MFDGTSLLAAWFCSARNAAYAAFTGLFSLRRLYINLMFFVRRLLLPVCRREIRALFPQQMHQRLRGGSGILKVDPDDTHHFDCKKIELIPMHLPIVCRWLRVCADDVRR